MKYNLKNFQFDTGNSEISTNENNDPYNSLSEAEISIVNGWKGLSPQGVAMGMCERFKNSHPDWEKEYRWCDEGRSEPERPLDEVAFPKNNTWEELEANLKQVARRFMMNEQCLEYWDKMRSLWRYLPGDSGQRVRRQVYRKLDKRKDGKDERRLEKMEMCSLCWRAVPVRKGITSRILCHNHNWSSKHPEYRRRFRMKYGKTPEGNSNHEELNDKYFELLKPFKKGQTVSWTDKKSGSKVNLRVEDAWNIAPYIVVKLLPFVYEYLLENGADVTSTISIIQTLESPLPEREKEDEIVMRSEFYENCRFYFRDYVQHLIWAEIWLEVEANTQRGGKRPGAGRKPKK